MSENGDKNYEQGESYQFPESEYVADSAHEDAHEQAPQAPGLFARFSTMKNRRVIIVMAVVVLAFIMFSFMRSSDHTKVIEQKPARPTIVQPNPEVQNSLDNIRQGQQSNQSTLDELQTRVSTLKSSLTAANQSQSQLEQSVTELSSQVALLTKKIQTMQKPVKKVHKHVKAAPQVVYHVKAVLPGRAWVVGSDGSEKTITMGNHLANYGKIESINTDTGEVVTSSGKVIDFGSNDD
ncbi:MAG: hypothetical protein K0U29_04080 [Gammaproteobacteria bacterium]|nr:hypothetical protein [Gammaproteobacteria bacterium]MCH9744093.1 hypothetical protein [Gammaproteobacteria bacterium]